MNIMEKAVWASVFASAWEWVDEPTASSVDVAIRRADLAVRALRRRGVDLHIDDDLEMERKAELDLTPAEMKRTWSTDSRVLTDVAEVKPIFEFFFNTKRPPNVLERFIRWLYETGGFRIIDPRQGVGVGGARKFHELTLHELAPLVYDFLGFDGGDDEVQALRGMVSRRDEAIKAWVEWRNRDHIVECLGGMSEQEEALAAIVEDGES